MYLAVPSKASVTRINLDSLWDAARRGESAAHIYGPAGGLPDTRCFLPVTDEGSERSRMDRD
jgi:hypothetical protein